MINKSTRKLSVISAMHYWKLIYRSIWFVIMLVVYIEHKIQNSGNMFGRIQDVPVISFIVWMVFIVEMILRFFPSKTESMGCQKQFKKNYVPPDPAKNIENDGPVLMSWKKTFLVAAVWILLNLLIGGFYLFGIYDAGILVLVSLAFSVCDMVCILFFCPFQTWMMKNKCCTTCRIYNWDYAMMFTPLVFIPNIFTWSLVLISLALLVEWEVIYKLHPERFSENTNQSIACVSCKEKLCHHKKQLQNYLKKEKIERSDSNK